MKKESHGKVFHTNQLNQKQNRQERYPGENQDEEKRNPVKQELRRKHRLQTYLHPENLLGLKKSFEE